jgi:hypothetical protein
VLKPHEKGKVVRLLKCIYGLKQAGRKWQKKMSRDLNGMGFEMSKVDHSVFVWHCGTETLIVPMSTNDMPVTRTSCEAIDTFKEELVSWFEITDLGELKWMLGFEIKQDCEARTIGINQKAYLEAMAAKFHLMNAKPAYTPMEPGTDFNQEQCPASPIDVPYQEACSSVLWPAVISCPDVAFAIGILAYFMQTLCTPTVWQSSMSWGTYTPPGVAQAQHLWEEMRERALSIGSSPEREPGGAQHDPEGRREVPKHLDHPGMFQRHQATGPKPTFSGMRLGSSRWWPSLWKDHQAVVGSSRTQGRTWGTMRGESRGHRQRYSSPRQASRALWR